MYGEDVILDISIGARKLPKSQIMIHILYIILLSTIWLLGNNIWGEGDNNLGIRISGS